MSNQTRESDTKIVLEQTRVYDASNILLDEMLTTKEGRESDFRLLLECTRAVAKSKIGDIICYKKRKRGKNE